MKAGWIVLGLVLLIVLGFGGCYNSLVTKHEAIKAQWSQVENVLQRRMDLIPNLVNTVKGYAKHERKLLENITKARSAWAGATTPQDKMAVNKNMDGMLSRLMVVVENYPQLKASENFLNLQNELAGTENRIAVERMRYNEAVKSYDIAVKQFPATLIAARMGFAVSGAYFEAEPAAKQAPEVKF